MSRRESLHTPAKLLGLFLFVVSVLFVALTCLGWYVIKQDTALEERRVRERLDSAANLVCGKLEHGLSGWEELLRRVAEGIPTNLPSDVTCVAFDSAGAVRLQSGPLVFLPFISSQQEPFAPLFAAAEVHEYREEDCHRAEAVYRELARREDTRLRAAALVRLARCLRKQDRAKDALAVYDELAALGGIQVAGSPAELLARRERVVLLKAIGDERGAPREAALLAESLREGKYPIDEATFDFYRESLPAPPAMMNKALAPAEAVKAVWELRQQPTNQESGRMSLTSQGTLMVALWHSAPAGEAVLVATADALLGPLGTTAAGLRVSVELEDPNRRLDAGRSNPGSNARVLKYPQETGLPLVVGVASVDRGLEAGISMKRRTLVMSGLALILLVIVGASYFVFRAVNRELGLARLQSDFVAAVSHEFRTPLTAMCHLTELLEEGKTTDDRLRLYYHALGKESRRLRGMVQSLLDFARIEAGRQVYRMEDVDLAGLVKEVVEEFREQASADGRRIEFEIPAGVYPARADREAIGRALWNLLDNAVKYSPDSSTVRLTVKAEGSEIAISVEDQGPGISSEEQTSIFRKFTRGAASRALNVKGTGIGLAMVDHIVKGHGGRVRLESEPGRGSAFTILIPGRSNRQ
jgi:two-component system phosphate regulon sensor histidine kinase PhoR